MRVLLDFQIFENQRFGGISRYHVELIRNAKALGVDYQLPNFFADNNYILDTPLASNWLGKSVNYHNFFWGREFRGKWKLYNYFVNHPTRHYQKNVKYSIAALTSQNFDLFHPTDSGTDYFLPFMGSRPLITTIHDTIDEAYEDEFRNEAHQAKLKSKKRIIEASEAIIAVSNFTKEQILKYYDISPKKIAVIYHGPNFTNINDVTPKKEHILYVGSRSSYKNFDFMLQALRERLLREKELTLICLGNRFSSAEQRAIEQMGLKEKVLAIVTDDDGLRHYYKTAKLFIYPSIMEGFGMPVLEAMSQGCPVLASNRASIPEVGGSVAKYFDPKNSSSFENALDELLSNDQMRSQMSEDGLKQTQMFSWEQAAKETFNLYKSVL